jgi:hypothetical protein
MHSTLPVCGCGVCIWERDRDGGVSTGPFMTLGLEEAHSTVPSMAGKIQ